MKTRYVLSSVVLVALLTPLIGRSVVTAIPGPRAASGPFDPTGVTHTQRNTLQVAGDMLVADNILGRFVDAGTGQVLGSYFYIAPLLLQLRDQGPNEHQFLVVFKHGRDSTQYTDIYG